MIQRQKSFENEMPTLFLVATPIGNLEELTPRAIDVLNTVDVIAAEDTRNTMKLLSHFDIHTRLISHHLHNEENSAQGILDLLESGKNVALVSDAGYPLINDPGERLVELVTQAGFNVVPLSGASAFLNALVASGLKTDEFIYLGFLPVSEKETARKLEEVRSLKQTLIFYEAPHRIQKTLNRLYKELGDRRMCLARELTKLHEEFIRGKISEIIEIADSLKGEMVLVVEGNTEEKRLTLSVNEINNLVDAQIQKGMSASSAIKEVAKMTGISKNEIYNNYQHRS